MSNRTKGAVTNDHSFNKNVLAAAVATAMFGTGFAQAATIEVNSGTTATLSTDNATSEYWLGANGTLSITGAVSQFYGTIEGTGVRSSANGTMSDSQRGNYLER